MAVAGAVLSLLRSLLPERLLAWRRRRIVLRRRAKNAQRSPRQIFSEVYAAGQWGGEPGQYYSGRGSEPAVSAAYCAAVRDFIAQHGIRSVLDLGCGDFAVGKQLVQPGISYTGVDVVAELIEHNRRRYGGPGVSFECLDIIEDPLPAADLCLVRQVLQHLSNQQIARVLEKLAGYPHVIVTEHYPAHADSRPANLDKPAGPDTRVLDGSAVFLDREPFNRPCRLLLTSPAPATVEPGETLRSYVVDVGRRLPR